MRGKITAAQFFVMMFVSRVVVAMGLNARALGGESFAEAAVSYLLSMVLGLALAVPALRLHRVRGVGAEFAFGKVGAVLYPVYFIGINAASLALFYLFLSRSTSQDFPALAALAAVLGAAVYGAWRGLETVARCAACVAALLTASTVLVFALVLPRFSVQNLLPLFSQGAGQLGSGILLFAARTSIFADLAVLLPFVRGDARRGMFGWVIGTSVFVCVLLVLLQGCLGAYGAVQEFPVYVLSSATEVRSLQRMDVVFVGIWLMGLVVRAACDLCACRVCLYRLCGSEKPRWVLLPAAGMLTLAVMLCGTVRGRLLLQNTPLLLVGTVVTGTMLPAIALWRTKRGKEEAK